jgi:hypothetical protein
MRKRGKTWSSSPSSISASARRRATSAELVGTISCVVVFGSVASAAGFVVVSGW